MNKGSLVYQDYLKLIEKGNICSKNIINSQIQPSSIDLTLSNECYEIKASFLAPNCKIREKLDSIIKKKINLNKGYIFKKNKTYLVRLNERLNLDNNIFGKCNPKSTTGRLDIFCRTILDFSNEYEKVPMNFKGEIFLEITSRSFDIAIRCEDSLNQLRLISKNHEYIVDKNLCNFHQKNPLVLNNGNKKIKADFSSGLKISVDLNKKNRFSAYVAKKNTPVLIFNKVRSHKIHQFWKPIETKKSFLLVEPGNFYILKSKEKIKIPINMAGEMIPYDTGIGDFRAHYAGFFDPGFGIPLGSYAVLEVKTNEVSFIIEDGQLIGRILYEKLNKKSKLVYGSNINSNYQNQDLALSKHFDVSAI